MSKNNALLIFIKAPVPGQVKTRLQPELTPKESLHIYQAIVEDLTSRLYNLEFCDTKIFYSPPNAGNELQKWLGDHFEYFPQHGKDLGDKMHFAFAEMFAEGYKKVVIIGSDLAALKRSILHNAFLNLKQNDLVLGPAVDGGYYLIGLKALHPELFEDISWSTEVVLQQTLAKAELSNLSVIQLDKSFDIDTYSDVVKLWFHFNQVERNGAYLPMVKTQRVLSKLFRNKDMLQNLEGIFK